MFDWFEEFSAKYPFLGFVLWLPVGWFLFVTLFIWWPVTLIIDVIKYFGKEKK